MLETEILYSYRKKIIIKWSFITLNIFLMLMNTWQFDLSNWQGVRLVWIISAFFVYTGLLVWTFLRSHKLNVTYCLKSLVDQTQMHPTSISPLGLFQEIVCNIHSVNPFIYRGVGILKDHRRGGSRFSLIIYKFCSSTALYLASLSFIMLIIISD